MFWFMATPTVVVMQVKPLQPNARRPPSNACPPISIARNALAVQLDRLRLIDSDFA